MTFLKKNLLRIIPLLLLVLSPSVGYSAQNPPCAAGTICNPITGADTLDGFILLILQGLIKIGIPIIAIALIYAGFLFVAARGNSEKLGKAKDAFFYTLIGAAILLGAWALAKLVQATVLSLQ